MVNPQHTVPGRTILFVLLSAMLTATAAAAFELNRCSVPALVIPDNDGAGIDDTLEVPTPGEIIDLDVWLDVSHTWVGDLVVTLEHLPTGTFVTLVDRPLDAAVNGCAGDDMKLFLDDEAAATIENDCVDVFPDPGPAYPLTAYVPGDPPAPLLAGFDGRDPAGVWRLTVSDHGADDTGTLNEWCLAADFAPASLIFADGFESGGVSAWSG